MKKIFPSPEVMVIMARQNNYSAAENEDHNYVTTKIMFSKLPEGKVKDFWIAMQQNLKLEIIEPSESEMGEIVALNRNNTTFTFEECSVFYYVVLLCGLYLSYPNFIRSKSKGIESDTENPEVTIKNNKISIKE